MCFWCKTFICGVFQWSTASIFSILFTYVRLWHDPKIKRSLVGHDCEHWCERLGIFISKTVTKLLGDEKRRFQIIQKIQETKDWITTFQLALRICFWLMWETTIKALDCCRKAASIIIFYSNLYWEKVTKSSIIVRIGSFLSKFERQKLLLRKSSFFTYKIHKIEA